jgi:quercetin dioxygenase-like cupin family protein
VSPVKKAKTLESLRAQALKLSDLVQYQTGTIVSREVIRQKTGTVTVFAFDKGQELSEHTAPFDAMIYNLDGEAEITISGQLYLLKKGEMIIMPARQPHAVKALKPFKMILIMVKS